MGLCRNFALRPVYVFPTFIGWAPDLMWFDLVANVKGYTTISINENKCDTSVFSVSGGFYVKLMEIKR